MTNSHHKMLHPRSVRDPKYSHEVSPERTQTEFAQVTKKTLRKKATGDKHIICLFFSSDIYLISPTFIKLIFKTVNGSCDNDIKRKAVPVIYNTVIEKLECFVVLKGGFFQHEIMYSSYRIFINCK